MPHVVLIRPGCTDYDQQNRVQGTLDVPMNVHGQEQVARIVDELRSMPIEVIYAPHCEPAWSTAERIGEELDVPVKESEELRNLNQGLWQGLPVDDIRHKYPRAFRQWQDAPQTICPPEGETVDKALQRIRKALSKPLKKKDVFAVVCSEPLATLVGFVLSGQPAAMPDPHCSCGERCRIDQLSVNGDPLDHGAPVAAAAPGGSNGQEGPKP